MGLWKNMRSRRLKKNLDDVLSPSSLVVRAVIALSLLGGGFIMLRETCAADILFTALPIIAGGIVLGPVLCQLAAAPFGYLFWPKLRQTDQPVYSTATTCRHRGRYDEAISHYRQILNDFPEALKAHAGLIEMTAIDMDDIELSRCFLVQADRMVRDQRTIQHLHQIFNEAERRHNAVHTQPERFKPSNLAGEPYDTHTSIPMDDAHVNTKPEGLL